MNHRPSRRLAGDGGGLTLEMAIITPVLFLILVGVLECGLAWRDSLSLSNAVRSSARVASSAGDDSSADHQALVALSSALEGLPSTEIRFVVVYDATGGSGANASIGGAVPEACKSTGATTSSVGGHPGVCNIYSGEWIRTVFDPEDTSPFEGQTGSASNPGCASTRADRAWCPLQREADQRAAGGPDYVGVYVATNHGWVTGAFGESGLDMQDNAVMRIEPQFGD